MSQEQEEMGCETPQGPVLCANNCGFFGSKTTMNLCSKCYRDVVIQQEQQQQIQLAIHPQPDQGEDVPPAAVAVAVAVTGEEAEAAVNLLSASPPPPTSSAQDPAAQPKATNRCLMCNKRLGLTGFKCRCGDFFCSLHRYSDKHNCSFDYKAAARDAISKANPLVKATKVDKI